MNRFKLKQSLNQLPCNSKEYKSLKDNHEEGINMRFIYIMFSSIFLLNIFCSGTAVASSDESESIFSDVDSYYGNSENWSYSSNWSVVESDDNKSLTMAKSNINYLSGNRLGEIALINDKYFDDFSLSLNAKSLEDLDSNSSADYAVVFSYTDENNYTYMLFNAKSSYNQLFKVSAGRRTVLATANYLEIEDNDFHEITIEKNGSSLTVSYDGETKLSYTNSDLGSGLIGVGSFNDAASFDDIYTSSDDSTQTLTQVSNPTGLTEVEVSSAIELYNAVSDYEGLGAYIKLNAGTYDCITIEAIYSEESPLIIDGLNNDNVTFTANYCSYPIELVDASYVAIKNVSITGGLAGLYAETSDHIIVDGVDVSSTRQGGIHITSNSSYVDVLNSKINNTGLQNPEYGECIYVGTGDTDNFPDATNHVWIENNDISDCGYAEAVNIKSEVFNTTVINNNIYNIIVGHSDYSQYNQSAITVEGAARNNNYLPTETRKIWLDSNTINNVTTKQDSYNIAGILVGGTGVYVVENTISNVEQYGILANSWGDLGLPIYLYENSIKNYGVSAIQESSGLHIYYTEAPENTNSIQTWAGTY